MTVDQGVWSALILAQAIVSSPFVIHLFSKRTTSMPILPEFQAAIDELNAAAAGIAALKAAVDAASGAPSTQDVADTLAAVQAAADGVKTAVGS